MLRPMRRRRRPRVSRRYERAIVTLFCLSAAMMLVVLYFLR